MAQCREHIAPFHWFPGYDDDCGKSVPDLKIENGTLASDRADLSAIMQELFTDANVGGGTWWGSSYVGGEVGSELWSLQGRGRNSDALIDYERHVRTALDKIVAHGLIEEYDVSVSFNGSETDLEITILRDGQTETFSSEFKGVF